MNTPPPVQAKNNVLFPESNPLSHDTVCQNVILFDVPISQSLTVTEDGVKGSSMEESTQEYPSDMEPQPSCSSTTTNDQDQFVFVEIVPPDVTYTNNSVDICIIPETSSPHSNNEAFNLQEPLTDNQSVQSKTVSSHSVLYRILKAPPRPQKPASSIASEQIQIVTVEVLEPEDTSSACLSANTKATVCSDISCSDELDGSNDKWVRIQPFVMSRALQMRPHVRSKSVQAGGPLRKRKRTSSCTITEVPEVIVPNAAESSVLKKAVPSSKLPPRPRKKRKVLPVQRRNMKTTTVRKRRIPDSEQCLEDLYEQLPECRKSEIIPLCGYDRVSSICREPFQTKEQWLADGFPKCFEICALIAQPVRLVIWLARRRLIRNQSSCPQCPNPMLLKTAMVDRHIYKWACRRCGRKLSIRHGSMFIKAGVSDPNIVLILYLWSVGYPTDFLGTEIETSLSSVRWYIWLALKSCAAELRREFRPLQGVVELHWDTFLRPTEKREGLNLLCGVERNSNKVFAVRCPRENDKNLLQRLIQNNIAVGSSIITRDLHMYAQLNLPGLGYMHYVLDRTHELALDDLVIDLSQVDDFVHTIKSFLRKQGGPGLFCKDIFLAEMIVRRTWGKDLLPMVLYSISRAYDIT